MRKVMVSLMVLAIGLPSSAALAADTAVTTAADCGSVPTAPAATATVQERQQFHEQVAQYRACVKNNVQSERTAIKDQKQQLVQDHCAIVTQRMNGRISNFQGTQGGDATLFQNVYQRLDNIATRLKGDGLDVTALTSDLATLKTKIDKINTDYASFIGALKDAQTVTCGNSQGEFQSKLASARSILMTVRQDRLDARSYIAGTVRPAIIALRQQLVKQEGSKGTSTASSSVTSTP